LPYVRNNFENYKKYESPNNFIYDFIKDLEN